MKKILFMLTSLLFLAGCGEVPELGKFVEVTVTDVEAIEQCDFSCWTDYEVTLEKDDTSVTLEVSEEEMANLLKKGNVVTVTYNQEYKITSVSFPLMEKK